AYAGDGIVNQGSIAAGVSGQFYVYGQSFTNQGSIAVSNGDTLEIASASFANSGAVNVHGATLRIYGYWSNTGSISETNGTLNLGGAFTTATLNTISHSGGIINILGALNNADTTLNVGTGTALGQLGLLGAPAGYIVGGTIADAGGGFSFQGGTLDG